MFWLVAAALCFPKFTMEYDKSMVPLTFIQYGMKSVQSMSMFIFSCFVEIFFLYISSDTFFTIEIFMVDKLTYPLVTFNCLFIYPSCTCLLHMTGCIIDVVYFRTYLFGQFLTHTHVHFLLLLHCSMKQYLSLDHCLYCHDD